MDLNLRLTAAIEAARASGEMLLAHPHTAAHHKAENDFVTEMDVASERLIRDHLLTRFPEDGFFGEETGGNENCEGRWIVDPIDGTSNFFKGELLWTISIAYEYKGELVLGVVLCPPTGELFTAVKGGGAFLNGAPICVSDESVLRSSFLHMSFCHRNPDANEYVMERLKEITERFSDLRRSGSAAYDLCSIAAGRCEGFFELYLHIYDIAAGVVILKEAGGYVSAWKREDDYRVSGHILATNGKIHEPLREILLAGDLSVLDN